MIKHLVQCGPCKKQVEASFNGNNVFVAPDGWLTINYNVIKEGTYVTLEDRHVCPDCAPKIVDILKRTL